jgi:hypothetical protein
MSSEAKKVKAWLVQGLSHRQIAKKLGISEERLVQDYAKELEAARPEARGMVGGYLFQHAMKGDLGAICHFLKTRAGWSETRHREVASDEIETDIDGPPEIFDMGFKLPCNTRNGCSKAGPKQRLIAFKEIYDELIAEAKNQGIALDFERPNVEPIHMWHIYSWLHGEKSERDG